MKALLVLELERGMRRPWAWSNLILAASFYSPHISALQVGPKCPYYHSGKPPWSPSYS